MPTPASATTKQTTVLPPLDGRVTSAPDEPHWTPYTGDYSFDVGGTGAAYARFRNANGSLSLTVANVSRACATQAFADGGDKIVLNVAIDGVKVGTVTYSHLTRFPITSGNVPVGAKIGDIVTAADGVSGSSCWGGPHVHVEPRNDIKYGCYFKGLLGSNANGSTPLGIVGGERATAPNTPCPTGAETVGPVGSQEPFGSYDQARSAEAGRVHVAGWAIDNDARTSPVTVHAYIGGEAGQPGAEGHDLGPASVTRPDVGAAHAGAGDQHGFDTAFTTGKTGPQPVCLYAINIGGGLNPLMGCKTVTIESAQPFGALDAADGGGGTLHVRGWALDRNAKTSPVGVHVYVGGPAGTSGAESHDLGLAATDRSDIGAAHPWAGSAHGFDKVIQTQKRGAQQVCAYAINVGPGENQLLGCLSATIGEVALAPPAPPTTQPAPAAVVSRHSGADRLGTAIAISKGTWADQQAQSVALARWDAFPDALAGTPLAVAKQAPLLLTPPAALDANIAGEIRRVLPAGRTVYLLGGTSALSQGVADAVTRLGYRVVRLGGADRYATAVTISRQLGTPAKVFLATGLSFQNALISGVAAAGKDGVVVLTADGQMPPATKDYLDSYPSVERIAVGPQASIADPTATKVAGSTVYDTARLLAQQYFPAPRTAALASGAVFADALAGGAHIGRLSGPLLLSEPTQLPTPVAGYLSMNKASISTATLYGGTTALSSSVEAAIRANLRQ